MLVTFIIVTHYVVGVFLVLVYAVIVAVVVATAVAVAVLVVVVVIAFMIRAGSLCLACRSAFAELLSD